MQFAVNLLLKDDDINGIPIACKKRKKTFQQPSVIYILTNIPILITYAMHRKFMIFFNNII